MRVAAYARYSSDQQSATSIDDQLRNVRAWCDRQGWPAPVVYSDAGITGARNDRPGYRRLLGDAAQYDAIVVDDLSRLSRDSIEAQQQVRRLKFAGVRVIAIADGIDTDDKGHKVGVGLRGLMGELYLDDLRDKTHRGLTGRALAGASAGGLPYGYRVTARGQREVDEAQAEVVRRIFADYLAGYSAREIAARLNADGVPSARGSTWAVSAIHGDTRRGIGILVNPIYVGVQLWNRSQWIKHPETGRRVRRERPESEWIRSEHPELAIISTETWSATQRRLRGQSRETGRAGRLPRHLLSGLLRCAECGGPMVIVDRYRYGCAVAKDRGTCSSTLRVPRVPAEHAMLAGIRRELLSDAAFAAYRRAFVARVRQSQPDGARVRKALADAEQVRDNVLKAIRAGIITPSTKAELERAERAVEAAKAALAAPKPETHLPRLRERWQRLADTLADRSRTTAELREVLQGLIGTATVKKTDGALVAEIAPSSQLAMVAGAGSVRYLTEPLRITITAAESRA